MRGGAVVLLGGGMLAVAAAYASAFLPGGAPAWAPALLAGGTGLSLAATTALGMRKRGRMGGLWPVLLFIVVVVGGGLAGLVWMPATDPADPELWWGLPPRAAVLLYGIGLLPALVAPVAYALTFERHTLTRDDLERVRHAAWARRAHPTGRDPDAGSRGEGGPGAARDSERGPGDDDGGAAR